MVFQESDGKSLQKYFNRSKAVYEFNMLHTELHRLQLMIKRKYIIIYSASHSGSDSEMTNVVHQIYLRTGMKQVLTPSSFH